MTDPITHKQHMQRKKSLINRRIRAANTDQGILLVNTGPGKGKSSAGFGVVARALGHDMEVAVIQFIKGSFSTGEEAFFSAPGEPPLPPHGGWL